MRRCHRLLLVLRPSQTPGPQPGEARTTILKCGSREQVKNGDVNFAAEPFRKQSTCLDMKGATPKNGHLDARSAARSTADSKGATEIN